MGGCERKFQTDIFWCVFFFLPFGVFCLSLFFRSSYLHNERSTTTTTNSFHLLILNNNQGGVGCFSVYCFPVV